MRTIDNIRLTNDNPESDNIYIKQGESRLIIVCNLPIGKVLSLTFASATGRKEVNPIHDIDIGKAIYLESWSWVGWIKIGANISSNDIWDLPVKINID